MGQINFRKGGSSSSNKVTADTLATNDTVEVLLGLCEGPIQGPVNGPRSFYADDTPLVNENGQPNFSNFSLDFWPGDEAGHDVKMTLGGFGSPFQVGVSLAKNVAVTRQGTQTQITAADFRIIIGQLMKQTDKGTFTDTLQLKFEYKKVSEATWHPCFSSDGTPTTGLQPGSSPDANPYGNTAAWVYGPLSKTTSSFEGDRQITTSTAATPDGEAIAITSEGVSHWDTGSSTWSLAQTTVPATSTYATFTEQVGTTNVTRRIYNPTNTTAPTGARTGDIWEKSVGEYYIFNGAAWVLPAEYSGNAITPQFLSNGVWSTTQKVSSSTPINIRVFFPAIDEAYQYRVTKLTTDTTTEQFSEVSWESVTELKQTPWHFDGVAMLKLLGQASDQFTSLPNWRGIYRGRIVKVPSNYDPDARTYTGIWDGTYRLAWTNNTAWIFQDFVENTRYGLSAIYPHVCNKWSIYAWAQYCDQMVPRADGTLQPRWTFNHALTEATNGEEMARYIAASAGATYVDDGNGIVDVLVDMDSQAVALFTRQNVGEDGFNYAYTERLTCHNHLTVTFINPDFNWQEDRRVVKDDDDIAANGLITDDFVAVGCTDVDEALRRGRRRMISELTERESVVFTTNRKGRFLRIWDKIIIADPGQGRGLSGRVRAITGARTITLRDPVSLEAGFTYILTFDIATEDGFETIRRTVVTPSGGGNYLLTVDADLPTLPANAAFTLEADGVIGMPKPFRILNIENDAGDGDNIKITAMEINVNKYAYIDDSVDLGTISYSSFDNKVVQPATDPKMDVAARQVGSLMTRVLTLSWKASPDKWVRRYKVYHSINGSVATMTETDDTSIEFDGSAIGKHDFVIIAVNLKGIESKPLNFSYNLQGQTRAVPAPTNLRLVGGLTATTFDTVDPTFAFDAVQLANLAGYQADIVDTTTSNVVRSYGLSTTSFSYPLAANKADGLRRTFKVQVRAYDQDLNFSDPITLTVTNPAPALGSVTVVNGIGQTTIAYSPPSDLDLKGIIVWASTTSGFVPAAGNIVYQGAGIATFKTTDGVPYYYRYAFFDAFGTTGLNMSAQASFNAGTSINGAYITPNTITNAQIAAGTLDIAAFAQSIKPPRVVTSLPTTGNQLNDTVIYQGKLYLYDGTKFVSVTDAANITGKLTSDQIQSIDAAKIVGDIVAASIADGSITMAKFASTIKPPEVVSVLPTTNLTLGRQVFLTTDKKNYRYDGTKWTASVNGADIDANSITAGQISAGAIGVTELAANSVTASKVFIGDTSNLILDPSFRDTNYWSIPSGVVIDMTASVLTVLKSDATLRATASGANPQAAVAAWASNIANAYAVEAGKSYRISSNFYHGSGYNGVSYFAIRFFDPSGTKIGSDLQISSTDYRTTSATSGALESKSGIIVAPPTAVKAVPIYYFYWPTGKTSAGNIWVSNPRMSLAVTGELIVDGTITGTNIAADAIKSTHIAAQQITSDLLAVNAVKAVNIDAAAVTTDKILANAITTAKLAVGAVGADQISANAIIASKLALTDLTNMIADPGFTDAAYWSFASGVVLDSGTGIANTTMATPVSLKMTGSGVAGQATQTNQTRFNSTAIIAVEAEKPYNVVAKTYHTSGYTGIPQIAIGWYDKSFSPLTSASKNGIDYRTTPATSNAAETLSMQVVAPTGAAYALVVLRGYWSTTLANAGTLNMGAPRMSRAINAELIVDGEVTASKIYVNNLAAISANLGAITAGSLNIANKFIVNPAGAVTIQSGTSGARVVMTNQLIQVFDANNVLRVRMGIW